MNIYIKRMPFRPTDRPLPLTPIAFEILLALGAGPTHGYGIVQAVERRAGSVLPLRAGTVYRALARLLEDGLIEEAGPGAAAAHDSRRRYYALTAHGREIARLEARRLADQLAAARAVRFLKGN
jgi:DNA-binding PadR family transcriptional regulator